MKQSLSISIIVILSISLLGSIGYILFLQSKTDVQIKGIHSFKKKIDTVPESYFVLGDSKYAERILDFFEHFEKNKVEKWAPLLTDDFVWENIAGERHSGRESFINRIATFRGNYAGLKITVDSWIILKSPHTKKEQTILVWFTEKFTEKSGNIVINKFHELFELNEQGKIRLIKLFTY